MVPMAPPKKLGEIAPREQVGSATGGLYEYQYQQAAGACLTILDDSSTYCVFCEWHDDFVVETRTPSCSLYGFHQVKTRTASQGPWPMRLFFGLGKPKLVNKKTKQKAIPPADSSSIAARMLMHQSNFASVCKKVVFVTNAGVEEEVKSLLEDVKNASDPKSIGGGSAVWFDELVQAYSQTFPGVVAEDVFAFLKILQIDSEVGQVADLDLNYFAMAKRILGLSEIDLKISEAVNIGRELVDIVRRKSQVVINSIPVDEDALRVSKGVTVEEVLKVLSLSSDAYKELKKQDGRALLTLSRLHRLCRRSGVPEQLIMSFCELKSEWDVWYRSAQHEGDPIELLGLRSECHKLLSAHVARIIDFSALGKAAAELADSFKPRLSTAAPLNKSLVLGCILALAAETGADL
jgi:Cap4-like dsDNA endonuclease family protein